MLPSLDRLAAKREYLKPGQIRMLVLAPTRELAAQIAASARTYGKFMQLKKRYKEITVHDKAINLDARENPFLPLQSSNPAEFRKHVENGRRIYYEWPLPGGSHELRTEHPLLHLRLFGERLFRTMNIARSAYSSGRPSRPIGCRSTRPSGWSA